MYCISYGINGPSWIAEHAVGDHTVDKLFRNQADSKSYLSSVISVELNGQ